MKIENKKSLYKSHKQVSFTTLVKLQGCNLTPLLYISILNINAHKKNHMTVPRALDATSPVMKVRS